MAQGYATSNGTADWIAFGTFLVLCVAAVMGETMWLVRKGWATFGRAVAYVLLTDVLAFAVGLFTIFIAMSVLIMMVFGASGGGGTSPESAYWAVVAFSLLFPSIFLLALKRLFLLILGIRTARPAWIYSLTVSGFIIVGVFAPPLVLFWVLRNLLQWN